LIGFSISLFSSFFSSKLRSNDRITSNNLIIIFTRFLNIILSLFFSLLGFGLLGLSFAFFLKSVILFLFFYNESKVLNFESQFNQKISFHGKIFDKNLIYILFNSSKQFLNSFSGWLVNKGTMLILVAYVSVADFNSYSVTLQIFGLLMSVSVVLFENFSPKIASLIRSNKKSDCFDLFSTSILISYIIQLLGSIFILFFGNLVLNLFSSSLYLNSDIIFLYSFFVFFELNQAIFSGFIALHNKFPFLFSSIISGIAIVIITFVGLIFYDFDIIHVIFTMFIIQSLYNFWRWPLYVLKEYKSNIFKVIKLGFFNLIHFADFEV
jgi:O-antigen/teichoic acid export membrane protein